MASRYRNIDKKVTEMGKEYKTNPIYPMPPLHEEDIYILSSEGDRYDLLARKYYGDSSNWWIIASANEEYTGGLAVPPGIQLRIPYRAERVLQMYEDLNRKR